MTRYTPDRYICIFISITVVSNVIDFYMRSYSFLLERQFRLGLTGTGFSYLTIDETSFIRKMSPDRRKEKEK